MPLAIVGVLVVAAVAVLIVVAALVIDGDSGDGEEPGVSLDNGSGAAGSAPEFVDAFPAEAPQGEPMDAATACGRAERISWADAEDYVESRVAILGPVTEIQEGADGSSELTLGRTEDETPVTVVVTQTAKRGLPAPPEELFGGEVVCVVGVLQAVGTQIEIFVNEPTDISIF